ncbi:hypothetical protein AM593_07593, partial [Mytilus galloprovincialis]
MDIEKPMQGANYAVWGSVIVEDCTIANALKSTGHQYHIFDLDKCKLQRFNVK